MRARLISDGETQTKVLTEDGSEVKGLLSVRWEHAGPDRLPTLSAEIAFIDADASGELTIYGSDPATGDLKPVQRIEFVDGTEWVAR